MLLISKFKSWLVSAAGWLVLLLFAFLKGRSTMQEEMEAGKRKDVIKETKAVADELVKAANTAKETQAKVSASSDSSVDSGLLKYTRD